MIDDKIGICQGATGDENVWSHVEAKLDPRIKEQRWQEARLLCAQCPVLDACEAYVSDLEEQGVYIDGVVAGRFSDVDAAHVINDCRQDRCCGCGQRMLPRRHQGSSDLAKHEGIERVHVGEGLCDQCWPIMSRKARGHGQAA